MSADRQDPTYLREHARLYRSDVERHERDDRETYAHLPEDHPEEQR